MKSAPFSKKVSKTAFWVMFLCLCCCLVGCGGGNSKSSSFDSNPNPNPNPSPGPSPSPSPDPDPPITGPQQFVLTGVDGAIQIRFSRNAPWGDGGIAAKYDLWYGTSSERLDGTHIGIDRLRAGGMLVSGKIGDGEAEGPLENGVTYYVWINAVYDGVGESEYHMETGMPVPVAQPPAVVYKSEGDTMVDISWDPVDWAFSYEVAIGTGTNPNAGNVPKVTTSKPRYMITARDFDGNPLVNDTTYNVWVRASNTNGVGAWSEIITVTPKAAITAPAAPVAPSVESGNKRLKVTWDAVRWATSYELYYGTTNNSGDASLAQEVSPASGKVSTTIAGLTNNTQYYVWVKAKNTLGSSEFSPLGSGTPQEVSVPIDFNDYSFQLGEATAEFIFAELRPLSPFVRGNSQGPWDRIVRAKETHLGNLFTDSIMWYLNDRYSDEFNEKVDFVFLNGGYINNLIKAGPISVNTVVGAVDSGSRDLEITLVSMKGSDIKAKLSSFEEKEGYVTDPEFVAGNKTFESLFDAVADETHTGVGTGGTGNWAIVSKEVSYTISYPFVDEDIMSASSLPSAITEPYQHGIIKPGTLKINGADFEDDKVYRIATVDRIADGLCHGSSDTRCPSAIVMALNGKDTKNLLIPYWHAVAEYIHEEGSVTPAIDGRIRIEGGVPNGPLGVPEGYNQYCPADAEYDGTYGCVWN